MVLMFVWADEPLFQSEGPGVLLISVHGDALVAQGRLGCRVAPITVMARDLRRSGADEL